jgi:hypothetical protein
MNGLRQALWRIGSADAVTWLSFWLTFAAAIIGGLVVMPSGVSWVARLSILGVGQLIAWAPLLLARRIALRMDQERRIAIAVVVLAAFGIGATARTLAVGYAYIWLLGPDAALWLGRALGSFGTMGLVFAITAYAVSSAREQRRRIQELDETQAALARSVEDARVDIGERGERSVQAVRGILEDELAGLQSVDAGGGVESLERLARDVVRPLSHELADAAATASEPVPRTSIAVSWPRVLDLAARGQPLRPLAVSLPMLPIILAAIALHPPATLRFLAIPVVTFLVLTAANPLAARALGQRSLRARLTILLLATAACGVTVGAMAVALVAREPVLLGTVLGSIFFVVFLSLAATVNAALDADRRITIARLETAAVQLRRNLALVNQVRWFQEKALSRALHGPVQTAIAAAAFKLDGALKTGDVTPDLIERLRRDVAREIDVLADVTRYSVPLDVGLQSIAATWDGVCRIEMTVDPEVSALVANDAPLRACTIAIAVESVSNAIRHGKSASVDLRMSADSAARELILEMETCSPTQAEVRPSGPTGLGTRQLYECATSWALEIRPEGQRLRANLPSRFLSA